MNYLTFYTRVYIRAFSILVVFAFAFSRSAEFSCIPLKYRTFDGSCNNLKFSEWGSSGTPFSRILPQKFENDLWPPVSSAISSSHLHQSGNDVCGELSLLFPLWGQILRLDLISPSSDGNVNEATAYLDASFIYGKLPENSFVVGRMWENGKISYEFCQMCDANPSKILKTIVVLFVSEHNRVADILLEKHPGWNDTLLFEESRRIVIAELQHITYDEYLPLLLGNDLSEELKTSYSDEIKTEIFGAFAQVVLPIVSYMKNQDNNIHSSIFGSLKHYSNSTFSLDFIPTKIVEEIMERSRSEGLPPYEDWKNYCIPFGEIYDSSQSQQNKNQNFSTQLTVDDLALGALLEGKSWGTLGGTFACLAFQQFYNIKNGDRFWYEETLRNGELKELRQVTLSSMLCSNIPDLEAIQTNAFLLSNAENDFLDCSKRAAFNLSAFNKEAPLGNLKQLVVSRLLQKAIRNAEDDMTRRKQTEYLLWSDKGGADPKSPIGIAAAFSKPNKAALLLANNSILLEYASNELFQLTRKRSDRRKRQSFDSDDTIISIANDFNSGNFLQDLDVSGFLPDILKEDGSGGVECSSETEACDPNYPYRSYTGYCNNLKKPHLGKAMTTFARMLPPAYENGISKPRLTSVMGVPLPSARYVSLMSHLDISHLSGKYTLMVMQFAQFVDHDITFTPVQRGFFASIPDCRTCDSPITVHPECLPIEIPPGDPFYPQVNETSGQRFCLPFMRSLPGQQRLGAREQINQNSAFLDASQIYGENACNARQLRSWLGRLNVTLSPYGDKELLPRSPSHPECKTKSGYCFVAGDGRASEQPGLTAIHTLFMREHNRVADLLKLVNPNWDDEKLYQQARRIVVAEYQNMVYGEFLPRLLGPSAMLIYGVKMEENENRFKGYSDECNPSIISEFASAAFRIGHSLLRPHIPRMSPAYQTLEPQILLRNTFFNPDLIFYEKNMIDEITRGLVGTPMEDLDQFITKEITNHLFEDLKVPHSGMDLPALNVQRARDHGIPSYNEFRAICNLKRATTWDDFSRELPPEVINRFRRLYLTVDDVDLFPAGVSERPVLGGMVGPTFACIIGSQFRQLRKCDRFWFETQNPALRFTDEQLLQIRKTTLAKLLCDNMDVPGPVQRQAFDQVSEENPRVQCHQLPTMDLSVWKERERIPQGQGCSLNGRTMSPGDSYFPTPCTSCVCTAQGARCATIRVTDCGKLLQEAGQEAVLKDEICSSQCASYLQNPLLNRFASGSQLVNRFLSGNQERFPFDARAINTFLADGLKPPAPPKIRRPLPPQPTRNFFREFASSVVIG